ncbi:MAG: hypothetical protein Ct9H90mP7_0030 [Candidatus Neomarinimicrobiota bacterium]|nr:MAG: hypothetical protein Ct9H90mP7_0030 [Candidatus Neomarinimicrobiota bacterium]
MDEYAQYQGTFTSYMMAAAMSYSTQLSPSSSFGMSAKLSYQHLVELGTGSEKKGRVPLLILVLTWVFMKKGWLTPQLDMGVTMTNIGQRFHL